MLAPHKLVLKDLLEEFRGLAERVEAAVARLEGLSPPTVMPPPDAAAVEAADRMVKRRVMEQQGKDPDYDA